LPTAPATLRTPTPFVDTRTKRTRPAAPSAPYQHARALPAKPAAPAKFTNAFTRKTTYQGKPTFSPIAFKPTTPTATGPGTLRIIPIGGCEEVGRNMTVFEYGEDILILDMGVQFPEEDMPGIDYVIPNTKYLVGKEKNIRGVIFSHGHLDHIGAAPILLEKLGNPPIIAMPLTLAMIKHRQEDYKKDTGGKLRPIPVKTINDVIKLGAFTLKFFQVEHSIMDSMGTIIETPCGSAIHAGDWTMEREEDGSTHIRYEQLQNVKRPSVLMLESLGAIREGRHATHEELYGNLTEILQNAPGRVILATFSSMVERVKWVLEAAQKLGKFVALEGYSMKMNIEIARELGYIKVGKGVQIDARDIRCVPDRFQNGPHMFLRSGAWHLRSIQI
jgi:ribonuclease J